MRHRYGAEVKLDTVLEIDARPARSISAPLPGDDGGTGFIGFVNEADGGIVATALYARSTKVMQVEGERILVDATWVTTRKLGTHVMAWTGQ